MDLDEANAAEEHPEAAVMVDEDVSTLLDGRGGGPMDSLLMVRYEWHVERQDQVRYARLT